MRRPQTTGLNPCIAQRAANSAGASFLTAVAAGITSLEFRCCWRTTLDYNDYPYIGAGQHEHPRPAGNDGDGPDRCYGTRQRVSYAVWAVERLAAPHHAYWGDRARARSCWYPSVRITAAWRCRHLAWLVTSHAAMYVEAVSGNKMFVSVQPVC